MAGKYPDGMLLGELIKELSKMEKEYGEDTLVFFQTASGYGDIVATELEWNGITREDLWPDSDYCGSLPSAVTVKLNDELDTDSLIEELESRGYVAEPNPVYPPQESLED